MASQHQHIQHIHHPSSNAEHHRGLDLDAVVFGENLAAVLDVSGIAAAHSIVDLGAGTGAGSRALRDRYPEATVTSVDNDRQMLEMLRQQGFTVVEADLEDGFPALTDPDPTMVQPPVDLVWASSSLHHVTQPGRLLSGIRSALAPGGVLVVAELAALPRFLSDPGEVLLEQRCHAAAAAEGWNHHPNWAPVLEAAGFSVTQAEVTSSAPATATAREYGQEWFARFLQLSALTADDRAAVAGLLKRFSDDVELDPHTTRSVWVATPQ